MPGLLDFLNTPAGLGLLSGVAGYAAGARRGTPVNNVGRGLVTGLSGYANANDQIAKDKENALTQQYKKMQMDQMAQTIADAKARREAAAGAMQDVNKPTQYAVGGQTFSDPQQAQLSAANMFSLPSDAVPGFGGAPDPLMGQPQTGISDLSGGQAAPIAEQKSPDVRTAMFNRLMQVGQIDEAMKYAPKEAKWTLGERYNEKTGMPEKVLYDANNPTDIRPFGGTKMASAPEGMRYDTNGNLVEIPGYVSMKQKIAVAGRAPQQHAQPYYSPVQTANGVMAFNARTGRMEPVMVNGQAVVGSQSDPTLQGGIAQSKAAGTTVGKSRAQAGIDLPNAIAQAQQTVKLVDDLLKAPGFSTAVGASSKLDPRNYVPGTDAYDFRVRLDQIKGQQFMQAYQTLKGGGQITEVEGKKATDAISRMNTASSEAEFKKAANEFKTVINAGLQRARMRAGVAGSQAAPAQQSGAPAMSLDEYLTSQGH